MDDKVTATVNTGCPTCGGAFVPDYRQAPAMLAARVRRTAQFPASGERLAAAILEKAAAHGVIHVCLNCGYQARLAA